MSQPAHVDMTLVDLVVTLGSVIARCETAVKAVDVEAPALARKHMLDSIQSAQGSLMQAEDLAIRHIRGLEDRLKQG